jgi:hypothetical protein
MEEKFGLKSSVDTVCARNDFINNSHRTDSKENAIAA